MATQVTQFSQDDISEALVLWAKARGAEINSADIRQFNLQRGDYDPHSYYIEASAPGAADL